MTDAVLRRIAWAQRDTWLDRVLQPRYLMGLVLLLFGLAGAAGLLATMHTVADPGAQTGWTGYIEGVCRDAGGVTTPVAAFLVRLVPRLFSAGALQVTLTVLVLIPVFLFADRILARRRVTG